MFSQYRRMMLVILLASLPALLAARVQAAGGQGGGPGGGGTGHVPCSQTPQLCAVNALISSISPSHGEQNDIVVLKGSGFTGVTEVDVGSTRLQPLQFTIVDDATIRVSMPPKPPGTTVPVTIPFGDGKIAAAPQPFAYAIGSMSISGPLDSYTQECWGCPDPWANGHSMEALNAPLQPQAPAAPCTDPRICVFERQIPGGAHVASIAVGTASPDFWVRAHFDPTGYQPGQQLNPGPGEEGIARGVAGAYEATLQRCVVPSNPTVQATNPDCTDYAGVAGNWQTVDDSGADSGITILPAQQGTSGDAWIEAKDPSQFGLQDFDLVRTYRLELTACLAGDPNQVDDPLIIASCVELGGQTIAYDTEYTGPFDAALSPAAVYQGKVLPYTILYQPPGDMSTAKATLTTAYGSEITVGSSSTVVNSMTYATSTEVEASARIGFDFQIGIGGGDNPAQLGFGGGVDIGTTQLNESSDQWARGTTATTEQTQSSSAATSITWAPEADAHLIPGDGAMCTVTPAPSMQNPGPYTYTCSPAEKPQNDPALAPWESWEPFWQDIFVLTVHPEFAVWTMGGQNTAQAMIGSAGFTTVTVAQLDRCRRGVPGACALAAADPSVTITNGKGAVYTAKDPDISLTPDEATALLRLDPFYWGGGQNAPVDGQRLLSLNEGGAYGMDNTTAANGGSHQEGVAPMSVAVTHSTVTGQRIQNDHSTEYDMTVTDMAGSSSFVGTDFNFAGTGGKYTVTNGESTTGINDVRMSFTDSTAVETSSAWDASGTIEDCDTTWKSVQGLVCLSGHDPLWMQPSVVISLDRKFGTLMYQDAHAATDPYENMQVLPPNCLACQGGQQFGGPSQLPPGGQPPCLVINCATPAPSPTPLPTPQGGGKLPCLTCGQSGGGAAPPAQGSQGNPQHGSPGQCQALACGAALVATATPTPSPSLAPR